MSLRAVAAILALAALAGCLSPAGEAPEAAAAVEPAGPPAPLAAAANGTAAPAAPPPLPAPTVATAGLSWSGCALSSVALTYKHEWAAGRVPPEYRLANLQAGNVGEAAWEVLACKGAAIGNATFVPEPRLAFFMVHVAPPPEVQSSTWDYYLLDAATDSALLAGQVAQATLPVHLAEFTLGEDGHTVRAGDGFAARVDEVQPTETPEASVWLSRLHWKDGERHCWVDVERQVAKERTAGAAFEGLGGNPAALSGPLHRHAGVAVLGVDSGAFTPPACLEG